ncbi:MAG: hypothetical protein WDZ49_01185 [Litorilinea sp.]
MSIQVRYPSYVDCVADALSNAAAPLSVEELLERIGDQRPLGSGARSAAYRAINKLFQAVQVEPGVFGWISSLLQGNIVRHQLSVEETRRGYILLDELEHILFYPDFFQRFRPDNRRIQIELMGGPTLQGEAAIERKTWSLRLGPALSRWIEELGGQSGDDLLITVMDAFAGRYAMRLQPHEIRDEANIRRRNIELAELAEELISEDRRTRPAVPAWEVAAKLIGRGIYAETPAVDDMHYVLHEYSGLRLVEGMGYQLDVDGSSVPRNRRYDANMFSELTDLGESQPMNQPFNEGRSGPGNDAEDDAEDYEDMLEDHFAAHFSQNETLSDAECETYSQYMQIFHEHGPAGESPLEHEDFHLLEAELEMLVRLEQEFGRLLPVQEQRKLALADQLFIDPDSLADLDWDTSDGEDYEDPPFWQN